MTTIRLIDMVGCLWFPHGGLGLPDSEGFSHGVKNAPSLLVRRYPAGDYDTCPWPMVEGLDPVPELRHRLACALYDERECNFFFPSGAQIELPDGTPFDFDTVLNVASRHAAAAPWLT